MEDLRVFETEEFGVIRIIIDRGKLYFCGADVARALGYREPHQAVAFNCFEDDKRKSTFFGGIVQTKEEIFVSKGGLYNLIVHGKFPLAERFDHWISEEVIPTIQKYEARMFRMNDDDVERALEDPDFLIRFAKRLKEEREKLKALESERRRKA